MVSRLFYQEPEMLRKRFLLGIENLSRITNNLENSIRMNDPYEPFIWSL